MSELVIDGRAIRYRVTGDGVPVVLTPGGRLGMDALGSLAAALGDEIRLIQWDRSNAGASDIWLGERSEQLQWTDDIADLLGHLGIDDAVFIGGSAGARLAYLTAIHRPEVVRATVQWSVSGGHYSSQLLGYQYHTPFIEAAIRGGMKAVADTLHFQELITANQRNRDALLAEDPEHFVQIMHGWNELFFCHPNTPVIGATTDELSSISVPTLIFDGNDDFHPSSAAVAAHELIKGSEFTPCAWTREEWMWRGTGRIQESVVELYPRMATTILDFIQRLPA